MKISQRGGIACYPGRTWTVYELINASNGRKYVGATIMNVRQRIYNHLGLLRRGCHYAKDMQHDFNNGHKFYMSIYARTKSTKTAYELEESRVDANCYNKQYKKPNGVINRVVVVESIGEFDNVTPPMTVKRIRKRQMHLL